MVSKRPAGYHTSEIHIGSLSLHTGTHRLYVERRAALGLAPVTGGTLAMLL